MVFTVTCSGSPYEIGHAHGKACASMIRSSIAFYDKMYQKTSKLDWDGAKKEAAVYEPNIRAKWPALLDEMQGVADGAGLSLADIVAINVRTEITFGMFTDGCTSLAWKTPETLFVAQNWDWMEEQKPNVVLLDIGPQQDGSPAVKFLTEAGMIGKIGINAAGVGVVCNAIRAKGTDPTKLPFHLALRVALNAPSTAAAVASLETYGLASSCHIMVGDASGDVTSMEWTHLGVRKLPLDPATGRIHHANHLLLDNHPAGVVDSNWLPDSAVRTARIRELADAAAGAAAPTNTPPTVASIQTLFCDEANLPSAICRLQTAVSESATLFNIVMDLAADRAEVLMGRPSQPDEKLVLAF